MASKVTQTEKKENAEKTQVFLVTSFFKQNPCDF